MSDNKEDPLKNNPINIATFEGTTSLPENGGPPLTAENLKLLGEPVVKPVVEPVVNPEIKPVVNPDKVPMKSQEEMKKLVEEQNDLLLKQVKTDLATSSSVPSSTVPSSVPSVPSVPATASEKPFVPVTTGGAQQSIDPLTSFLLNMMFIVLFYYVATKIFTFYGVGTEVYGIYFTFYLFLYLTTMILPTEYPKIK